MLLGFSEFPFIGSQAFELGTARPVTILQDCGEGGMLVRRDDVPRPGEAVHGNAAGNCRIARADLVATECEALLPSRPKPRRKAKGRI